MKTLLILFALLAFALPVSAAPPQETIGTVPIVVHRTLLAEPGTVVTAQRGNLLVVLSTADDLALTTGETWSASWVSGGTTFTVTIVQGENESDDDAAHRLDGRVRAMQRLRPRDGAATGWTIPLEAGWLELVA